VDRHAWAGENERVENGREEKRRKQTRREEKHRKQLIAYSAIVFIFIFHGLFSVVKIPNVRSRDQSCSAVVDIDIIDEMHNYLQMLRREEGKWGRKIGQIVRRDRSGVRMNGGKNTR
jgi:hypothetical protein